MSFNDIEIHPWKLQCSHHHLHDTVAGNLQKYHEEYECSDGSGADDSYGSDHFRMYEFKVRRCPRSRSHDWTNCPFAHPGEKARRRDPKRYRYSSTVCSDFRRDGVCPRGDDCEFAHGVFECWLHPTRYRTEACKDDKNCEREVCFFAHSSRELRLLPDPPSPKYKNPDMNHNSSNHCCLFCHSLTTSSSPTSTLFAPSQFSRSSSLSPPLSPLNQQTSGFSPVSSRYSSNSTTGRLSQHGPEMPTNYDDVLLKELVSSFKTMNLYDASSSPMVVAANANQYAVVCDPAPDLRWVDELLM